MRFDRPVLAALAALAAPLAAAAALVSMPACGGSTPPPKSADNTPASADGGTPDGATIEAAAPSVCAGTDLDLANVLVQSACEVPNPGNDAKQRDVSQLLTVTATPSSPGVAPGGHVDVVVTYTNKSDAPLPLPFHARPDAALHDRGLHVDESPRRHAEVAPAARQG